MAQRSFWEKHILPYFMFNKGERNGILFLLVLLALTWLIPSLLPGKAIPLQPEELILIDSFQRARFGPEKDPGRSNERYRLNEESGPGGKGDDARGRERRAFTLRHPFDPNTASEGVWESTGLPAHTIRTIQRYLAKGGRFRKPGDLQKIYGLSGQDYETLKPYLKIEAGADNRSNTTRGRGPGDSNSYRRKGEGYDGARRFGQNGSGQSFPGRPARQPRTLDINEADSADWESLPGIGPVLARRILLFRGGLGGFSSVEQVGEVYGLPDSVFRRIRPQLVSEAKDRIIPLYINRASQAILEKHPYISRKLAALIVAYRTQHGPFSRADELMAIPLVTPELLKQLEPYLSFN